MVARGVNLGARKQPDDRYLYAYDRRLLRSAPTNSLKTLSSDRSIGKFPEPYKKSKQWLTYFTLTVRSKLFWDSNPPRCRKGSTEDSSERLMAANSDGDAHSSESLCVTPPLPPPVVHPSKHTKPITDRTQKVKDARSEAQKEIEEYKKRKENELKEFESKHSGFNAKAEEEATKEIEQSLKDIEAATKEKGPRVIEDLLKAVTHAKPEPHRNVAASA
ncbi:H+-ATPase G subunit-domain-containing protein [Tuber brumale]|nr:H+-ATPase G subunit-domain-containing protein [Tuber brumale]